MSNVGWDFDTNQGSGGGSSKAEFTKFPQGVTRVRIVDDAPYSRWIHWMNKHRRSINCPGMKVCPICDIRRKEKANKMPYSHSLQQKLAINVLNRETGNLEIMEQGKTFFEDVRDLMTDLKEKGKTLLDVDLRVRRRGTGQDDTSYRIDIDEEYPMSEEDWEKIHEGKIKLDEYFKPHTPEQINRILQGENWDDVMKQSDDNAQPNASGNANPFEPDEDIELK